MTKQKASLIAVTTATALSVIMPQTVLATKGQPAGNNGTIKLDRQPFDKHPNNQPHVGCTFELDFYNYDKSNNQATYVFELQSPTGKGELLRGQTFVGQDAASGGTDLDAEVEINLQPALARAGVTPHPKQGYHVKVTVSAPGSQGADTKHKVFWVKDCAAPAAAGTSDKSPVPTPSATGSVLGSAPTTLPAITVDQLPSTGPGGIVLGSLLALVFGLVGRKLATT
jgi:hypothetical protein